MARIKKCPECGTSNKLNAALCKTDRISLRNVSPTEEKIMSADESIEAVNTDTKTAQGEKFPCPNCDAMVNPGEPECIYCHTPLTSEQPPISLDESPGNSIANLKLDINGNLFEVDKRIVFGRDKNTSPIASLIPHQLDNVSRTHAELWIEAGSAYVRDLNSTNGTFVNERRIQPHIATQIKDGDSIRFAADLTVRVRICHV
jgi:hypothetical protein